VLASSGRLDPKVQLLEKSFTGCRLLTDGCEAIDTR
jgi:hypothetical protein